MLPVITGAGHGDESVRGPVEALAIAAFATLTVSTLLAYASQVIYRILEGYHLPAVLERRWTTRQRQRQARLLSLRDVLARTPAGRHSRKYGLALEQVGLYPHSADLVMPTRLGNALRTLETYGQDRFGLDSQQFWFELIGTAQDSVRRESEEARAQVDLFVAAVSVFSILALASTIVGLGLGEPASMILGLASGLAVPLAYYGALRNMKDWANSVRALINLGRLPVASGVGVQLPWKLEDERRMWQALSGVLHYRDDNWRPWLDVFRRGSKYVDQDGLLRSVPESDTR
jgi:hypothetical protein